MGSYPKEKRRKLDAKNEKASFYGYGESTKGFRICFSNKNTVTLDIDSISDSNEKPFHSIKNENLVLGLINSEHHQNSKFKEDKDNNMDSNNLANNQQKTKIMTIAVQIALQLNNKRM